MSNASINSFATSYDIFIPFVMLVIAVGVLSLLLYASTGFDKYKRFHDMLLFFARLFSYAAYGGLTVAVVGLPVLIGWWFIGYASENPSSTFEVLRFVGIIFGGLFGLAGVGYLFKNRVWKRLFGFHKAVVDRKEYVKNMDELPRGESLD